MQQFNDILQTIDGYIGGSQWFVIALLGTGLFFTFYLRFPQIRFFRHALRIVTGRYDKQGDEGDTSHFQALATALSGTVGTGNIAGVALAIHLGGPAALFWMLITAFLGMTTKFVEVTLSHKYREKTEDGTMAGGPMYYMKNAKFKLFDKPVNLGWLAVAFAIATIISSFGTGNLPQVNSIANSIHTTFGIEKWITGAVLSILLGLVIIGGIKRIAAVTEKLVPIMALIYISGAILVLIYNYQNILPSIQSVFSDVFTGSAATGGFLGAALIFAFNRGVNRGLFSNEAGQGSAPIAHASAKAHEPVSEGMVAILEPFIDTIVICTLTGLVILSSGVWKEKVENVFQNTDLVILQGNYVETSDVDKKMLFEHFNNGEQLAPFTGTITVLDGAIEPSGEFTILHARSVAEDIQVIIGADRLFSGELRVSEGKLDDERQSIHLVGKSLLHSAPLTTQAFTRSYMGDYGQVIISIGLLLFAFSTTIAWSYYGDRAVTFLFGTRAITVYRIVYIIGFFVASFTDTTIIWTFSGIAIAVMTLPNLIGIFWLRKDMKDTVADYWDKFENK